MLAAWFRDRSVYASSQWEMVLQCNAISHWLGAYTEWYLTDCLDSWDTLFHSLLSISLNYRNPLWTTSHLMLPCSFKSHISLPNWLANLQLIIFMGSNDILFRVIHTQWYLTSNQCHCVWNIDCISFVKDFLNWLILFQYISFILYLGAYEIW